MNAADTVFDPGLQLERTSLAWQRAVLAFGVALLAMSRTVAHLVPGAGPAIGWWGTVIAIAVVLAGSLLLRRRYRSAHRSLMADAALAHDGRAILAAFLVILVLGSVAAVLVVVSALTA